MFKYLINLLFNKKRSNKSNSFISNVLKRFSAGSIFLQQGRFISEEERDRRKANVLKLKF